MSHPPNHTHHGMGADNGADDSIDFKKVIGVGVISLVVFALGTVWAVTILHRETARAHAATGLSRPPMLGQSEIGIVDQVLFTGDHRLADWKAERAAHLNGYGWVDRSKGIAHIPIEKAIEEVVSGALPEGAPKDNAAPAASGSPAPKAATAPKGAAAPKGAKAPKGAAQ